MNYDDLINHFGGSQTKVAAAIGISQSAISRWKTDNGGRIPRIQQFVIQALTLGVLEPDVDVLNPGPSMQRGVRVARVKRPRRVKRSKRGIRRRKPAAEPASDASALADPTAEALAS